jgi:hypothetical protein
VNVSWKMRMRLYDAIFCAAVICCKGIRNLHLGRFLGPLVKICEKQLLAASCQSAVGRDSSVGIATTLRAGRSGDRIPVGARFSTPVQTGPGAYPASCTMGTGSFSGIKRPGRGLTNHYHLAPMLKKEYSYTSTPPLGLHGLF